MARTPYDPVPESSASGPSGAFEQVQSSPSDFGGQIGAATQKLGADIGQAGDALGDAAVRMQLQNNDRDATNALGTFTQHAGELNAKYRTLTGQQATDAYPQFLTDLRTARENIAGGLGSTAAQNAFRKSAGFLEGRFSVENSSYAAAQQKESWKQAKVSNVDNMTNVGVQMSNQPSVVATAANSVKASVADLGSLNGWDPDTVKANTAAAVGKYYETVIGSVLAGDPANGSARAQAIFAQARPDMDGPSILRVEGALKPIIRNQASDAIVRSLIPAGPGAASANGDTAAIWANMKGIESGNKQTDASGATIVSTKLAGDSDAPVGITQIRPSTAADIAMSVTGSPLDRQRLMRDASYNEQLGHAYFNQQLDTYKNPMLAAAAYNAGPGRVDGWLKTIGDPRTGAISEADFVAKIPLKETRDYVNNAGAVSNDGASAGGSAAYPDESAIYKKAMDLTEGQPELRESVLAKVSGAFSKMRILTATDRNDLQHSLPDLQAAALGGQDITIPEDRIRHLLPPADAAREIENLSVAQSAGKVFKGIQWGSSDDVNAAWKDLSSGLGPISTMIRSKTAPKFGAPGAAQPGSDQDSPEAYRLRTSILHQFEQQVQARNGALGTDPAAYVSSEPNVAAALQATHDNPNDPTALKAYLNASLTVQSHLGLPEDQQHVMTAQQAQSTARRLMSIDPSKGDMGAELSGIARQYGDAWPKAFGDLVKLGKLPGEYQILAAMPDPVARTSFQRALAATSQRGGLAKLREDVPPQAAKDIDQGLDASIDQFRQTASIPGLTSNVGLIANVRDAIKTFAYHDALQTGDGQKALQHATDAVLNDKYDFSGTMRVPKGMLPAAEIATRDAVNGLKASDLAPLAADTMATAEGPGMTTEQRQAVTLTAAQRGKWIPNESDTGLVLVGQLRNGAMVQMRRADGSRVDLPFKAMGAARPPLAPNAAASGGSPAATAMSALGAMN